MTSNEGWINHREIFLICVLTALGTLIRITKINQPFIDAWSWRQSDVAMIAENFYRNGYHIFYPQINWAGSSPGYVGTEFQLVSFLASLFYPFFGEQSWIGRSVSVSFFAFSIPFLYLLVKKVSNERSAFFAVGTYILIPLSIFSSRSFMSDTASLSFSIAALYLFSEWIEKTNSIKYFIGSILATSLSILIKLPAIIIGLPFLYMAWRVYGTRLLLKRELWAFLILSLILPVAWYYHAYLISISHVPHDYWVAGQIKLMDPDWYAGIFLMTVTKSLNPIVFFLMLVGIILPAPSKFGRLFHWWLVAIIISVIIAGWGNRHEWYRLPLVPVAAALAGKSCDFALNRFARFVTNKIYDRIAIVLIFFSIAYLSYYYIKPKYDPWALPLLNAGKEIKAIASPDALVIVVGSDPTGIFFTGRKGWHFLNRGIGWGAPSDSLQAIDELEDLRKDGATYLVFNRYNTWWLDFYKDFQKHVDSRYRRIRDTDEFIIFDLKTADHK